MASRADLGPYLEKFVSSLVSSGRYNSKREVLREAVRLVEERERGLAALDRALDRGVARPKAKYRKAAKPKV